MEFQTGIPFRPPCGKAWCLGEEGGMVGCKSGTGRWASLAVVVFLAVAVGCGGDMGVQDAAAAVDRGEAQPEINAWCSGWTEYPGNPIIEPYKPEFLIGDPTVLTPAESPDGRWHLFANGLLGLYHDVSDDGVHFELVAGPMFGVGAIRPFILRDRDRYVLYYERYLTLETSEIEARTSPDLSTWSDPVTVLVPNLPWEQTVQATVGNPYVTVEDGVVWLYYSADRVYQEDTKFYEPRVVGLARSTSGFLGPFVKEPHPLIEPSEDTPWRNRGAGSFKLLDGRWNGRLVALENGIYQDAQGHSRSAILVLDSTDGLDWHLLCGGRPILSPSGNGWKRAFVYAFDTARYGGRLFLYFNARDGWRKGTERIGLAFHPLP